MSSSSKFLHRIFSFSSINSQGLALWSACGSGQYQEAQKILEDNRNKLPTLLTWRNEVKTTLFTIAITCLMNLWLIALEWLDMSSSRGEERSLRNCPSFANKRCKHWRRQLCNEKLRQICHGWSFWMPFHCFLRTAGPLYMSPLAMAIFIFVKH